MSDLALWLAAAPLLLVGGFFLLVVVLALRNSRDG